VAKLDCSKLFTRGLLQHTRAVECPHFLQDFRKIGSTSAVILRIGRVRLLVDWRLIKARANRDHTQTRTHARRRRCAADVTRKIAVHDVYGTRRRTEHVITRRSSSSVYARTVWYEGVHCWCARWDKGPRPRTGAGNY